MLKSSQRDKMRAYYQAYYNNHFLRNFRFIFDKRQHFMKDGERIEYQAKSLTAYKYNDNDTSGTKALKFLMGNSRSKYGLLAGEITYYKTLEDFKQGKLDKRFCDRLFFDEDVEDPQVDVLKDKFKQANNTLEGKDLAKRYKQLQKEFQALIFKEDLLFDVYEEAQKLCNYLSKYGLKPYLIFSGKGFHVNVFFNEMQLRNLSQISQTLAMTYTKELKLKYIDTNVFDKNKAHKRLQRCQYALHSKSGLISRPLPSNMAYDEMIAHIKKNKRDPIDFNFNEMLAPEGFNKMLKKLDDEITFKNNQRKQELERINKTKKLQMQKKFKGKYKSFDEIDMRDIANAYGIDGRHQGDRIIVNCPFHHDLHPSAVVFEKRFHCSTCNMTLNYYAFISKLEGTDDKDVIIKKAMEFLE